MTRTEFIKVCGLLGISLPFQSVITACNNDDDNNTGNIGTSPGSESVLIIGAGAAGMSSGYLLAQQGINFQILEASSTYGGRMKQTATFADFPIPLGAEWLHSTASELNTIVNDPSVQVTTQLQEYSIQDPVSHYQNGTLLNGTFADVGGTLDLKFINSTWFDFFDTYIVPSIQNKMTFNTQVTAINYEGDQVEVTTNTGQTYTADKVIVTVPLKILQNNVINFSPALSASKQQAIQGATIWSGIKVFLEFNQKFYNTMLSFADSDTNDGQRIYYDASYGQNTATHVLGLFAVGQQAEVYQAYSGDALRDYILNELDQVYNNVPSQTYVKHIVQNWNEEPHIGAAYLADDASSSITNILATSINNKVFFAGDAYTQFDNWSTVDSAAQSARDVVNAIV